MSLTVGSLFSGIGGLDLGLERAGMVVKWQSEIDPYCSQVLAKHWPHVPNLGDVKSIEWETVERVDLICGGYPCQPFSLAGSRRGTDDDRHLWPYMRDAIGFLRPRYALLENVAGHLSLGFGDVLGELVALGYDAEWDCVPAAAVGAPHRRDRLFVVAALADAASVDGSWPVAGGDRPGRPEGPVGDRGDSPITADTDSSARLGARPAGETILGYGALERLGRRRSSLGEQWAVEPDVGRVAHGVPDRLDRLRGLGNAVVPQVAQWIGEQIMAAA